jgi:hypothetical protein
VWALVAVALLVAFAPIQKTHTMSRFPDIEYRLRFVNGNGPPVPNVRLHVETPAGGASPFYPVNEFLPDAAPASGADGLMVFHHVAVGNEFGTGLTRQSLFDILVWDLSGSRPEPPRYACIFLLDGREVYRTSYDSLAPKKLSDCTRVTRNWRYPNWDRSKYLPQGHEDWDACHRRLFDRESDATLGREERIAINQFQRGVELGSREEVIEFPVVERTIVVPNR